MARTEIDMMEMAKRMTMKVRIVNTKQFCIRLRVGAALMRLAAHIMGMGIKIEKE